MAILKGTGFVASYSGGKDSLLAIHRAICQGMELKALLITYNRDREHSWFHGIPPEVLKLVERESGVPVRLVSTSGEEYSRRFEEALSLGREAGAQACVFGDIDLEGHREWGEARCRAAGMEAVYPLWGEDRKQLVLEGIGEGIRSRITVVDTSRLESRFLGRLLTPALLEELEAAGVDPCGENGEYHTFAFDAPLFSHPILFQFDSPLDWEGYQVLPLAPRFQEPVLERGYTQAYTGDGKGKTTAALGLALRGVGAGMKVYFGQFMKQQRTSEIIALEKLGSQVEVAQYGTGGELARMDLEEDRKAAREGISQARLALYSGRYDLVVLDEIHVACYLGYLKEEELLELMREKPRRTELVLTGRYAPQRVLDQADLVTRMEEIRHYYQSGVPAREGIEL